MYIYIFKNLTSQKQYIGFTTQDINSYLGSGKYWNNHCDKYGGKTKENISLEWYQWYDSKEDGLAFLEQFESEHPNYWETDEWCNLVPETLEDSPFKGNMDDIFERNGNPFTGGEIQRKMHAEGRGNPNPSLTAKKGWVKRDRKEAGRKMQEGHSKWKEENKEYFLAEQRRKLKLAHEALRLKQQKLEYEGQIYYGWAELSRATGKSKYYLKKDERVTLL